MIKKSYKLITALLASVMLLTACGGGGQGAKDGDTIAVGSRNNTESIILSHIIGQMIDAKTDLNVVYRENMGGSNVVWNAITSDNIQVIPDYTGTIVANYYQAEPGNADETLAMVKEFVAEDGLTALEPFGFNNTYTLALYEDKAEELGVVTFSDFAEHAKDFTFGAVFEFIDRPDGLPGFSKEYGIEFKEVKGMDHGMMYRAIDSGEVDVINSYTTDGQLTEYDLRVLEDDKSFFPPYHALPLVRQDTLEAHPELEEVLLQLAGKINEETMQKMNGQVDNDGERVDAVAKRFLTEAGLIE
ncbi:glycine betaine ABC transporter substrate-binding protein [Ammoniphilus oxalaticus]|nr:glycine betaine ABC transporter substrate-binding protein [Ammoniphilus oxalaticus]